MENPAEWPVPRPIVGETTYQNLEDGIVDARNDEARLYAINADLNPNEPRKPEAWVCASADIPVLEFPELPSIEIDGLEDGAPVRGLSLFLAANASSAA